MGLVIVHNCTHMHTQKKIHIHGEFLYFWKKEKKISLNTFCRARTLENVEKEPFPLEKKPPSPIPRKKAPSPIPHKKGKRRRPSFIKRKKKEYFLNSDVT